MKKTNALTTLIFLFVVVFAIVGSSIVPINPPTKGDVASTTDVPPGKIERANVAEAFSYQGENGKDALALLKEKTTVEQNASGLVIGINGETADMNKKEFWAFSVNGKMADQGPKDTITKDSDVIEWKIEHY